MTRVIRVVAVAIAAWAGLTLPGQIELERAQAAQRRRL